MWVEPAGPDSWVGNPMTEHLLKNAIKKTLPDDGERPLLYVPTGVTAEPHPELLANWYREQLRHALPDSIALWEPGGQCLSS
jgi:hypothetical protein